MSQPEEAGTGAVQFAWGEKRGRGKENVQFYGSFTYDSEDYSLYDCVYLYHDGEPEPFIGKIVKMWEQPIQKRRVKILWFFRPIEIRNFLGECEEPLRNELFLATGEGTGVSNVNPLEAIAGKCNVVCISKDKRNPQPSDEDVRTADYIFYRTFDVGSHIISDKIGDNIAGIEAKYIFSWKEILNNSVGDGRSDKNGTSNKSPQPANLAPEADQSVDKSLSGVKAIAESEPALHTDTRKAGLLDALDERPSKKIRLSDSAKPTEYFQKNGSSVRKEEVILDEIDKKSSADVRRVSLDKTSADKTKVSLDKTSADVTKVSLDKAKSKHDVDLVRLDKGSAGKSKLDAITGKSSDGSFRMPSLGLVKEQKFTSEAVVVPRKPELDTSKWFTGLPWEDRMWKAHEQGTLVLLENFDIAYTSEEIEDLIYHFFKKKCTARVIELSTFSNPNHGQALIICKNRGDADEIVKELKTRVLMLSNGRPLVGRRANPRQPGKTPKFFGHFFIDKLKQQMQREEWRKAVATSHCSQPNTIEYEMGMDWMLLQEKSSSWWRELHKGQKEETKQATRVAKK